MGHCPVWPYLPVGSVVAARDAPRVYYEYRSERHPAGCVGGSQEAACFVAATLVVVLAARLLIGAATELVEQTEVTTGFFGLSVLAVVTSLPEIAVSIAGIRAGCYDLVVGNLLGSHALPW